MLLKEIKTIYHKELDEKYGVQEVDSFFYLLIEHYLKLERFILAIDPEYIIQKKQEYPLFQALNRLGLNEPIQHIIGEAYFMDMLFKVSKNVLIPRPETEDLVRWVLKDHFENNKGKNIKILDIGTGSGCIAISLAKNSTADVFALDISEKALVVAKENALKNKVKIIFMNEDIFNIETNIAFDIIVSNPPYVRELEKKEMHANVLDSEPALALFVSDEDPLVFYREIIKFAQKNLKEKGFLYFEINQYLGKETEELLKEFDFSEIELRKDIFGNHRMLKGRRN